MEDARENIMQAALNEVPSRLDANGKELKRKAANMAKRFRENGYLTGDGFTGLIVGPPPVAPPSCGG